MHSHLKCVPTMSYIFSCNSYYNRIGKELLVGGRSDGPKMKKLTLCFSFLPRGSFFFLLFHLLLLVLRAYFSFDLIRLAWPSLALRRRRPAILSTRSPYTQNLQFILTEPHTTCNYPRWKFCDLFYSHCLQPCLDLRFIRAWITERQIVRWERWCDFDLEEFLVSWIDI